MKKIIAISALIFSVLFLCTCRQDPKMPEPNPCAGITCENGGICNDGKCNCPAGFSGEHCETYYTEILAGKYTSTNFNCGLFPLAGDADITVNPENKNQLFLPNGLVANMSDYNFTVPPKSVSAASIWGEGYFEGEKMHLKLYFGSVITGVLGSCEGDYYKVK
jgi:hypothetical protein